MTMHRARIALDAAIHDAQRGHRVHEYERTSNALAVAAIDYIAHVEAKRAQAEGEAAAGHAIDADHIERQRAWSARTFGPGLRLGVLDHIRKELVEIEADPTDLKEWADVIILALDGAWRAGHEPQAIIDTVRAKQARNESREWPDWRTMPSDKAIEHTHRGRVYIAGPIAGHADGNRAAFARKAAQLEGAGYDPVNPHDVQPHEHDGDCPTTGYFPGENDQQRTSSCCFMRTDLTALLSCDYITMLDNWQLSKGATFEREVARVCGIPHLPAEATP